MVGGRSLYGSERFRLVWGWDVRDFTGEHLFFRYDIPERWLERFHLEYWVPPETYGSPEAWSYKELDRYVGLFPRSGGYERFITFEKAKTHEFIEPTPALVTEAVGLFRRRPRLGDDELRSRIYEEMDTKHEAGIKKRHDIIDANVGAFGLTPWMAVSGPLTPTSRRTDWRTRL